MRCVIDLSGIKTREQFHTTIVENLACPPYYGRNFDALYDILTDYNENLELSFEGFADFSHDLPGCGRTLQELCEDAMRENPLLHITFQK